MKNLIVGDKGTVERLAERLKRAASHSEYQRIQCVLIRATLGSSAAQIAQLLGWSTATVHVMHSRWAKEGEAIFDVRRRGGRRHQHLTPEQEQELLAPFVQRAHDGGMLTVAEIEQAIISARIDAHRENRPVTVTFEDAAAVASRLRRPSTRTGMLRIVTIEGHDVSACGGTHTRATGEIGAILLRFAAPSPTEKVRPAVEASEKVPCDAASVASSAVIRATPSCTASSPAASAVTRFP